MLRLFCLYCSMFVRHIYLTEDEYARSYWQCDRCKTVKSSRNFSQIEKRLLNEWKEKDSGADE